MKIVYNDDFSFLEQKNREILSRKHKFLIWYIEGSGYTNAYLAVKLSILLSLRKGILLKDCGTVQLLCPFSGCTVSGSSFFFHFSMLYRNSFHYDSRDAVGRA